MIERIKSITIIVLTVMLFSVWHAYAGNPAGPGTPPASTNSYTLADIYNRLNDGTAGSQSTFTEPSAGPATGTMYTLNQIMAEAPTLDNTNGATTASVKSGKTFWGLTSGQWALQTGTAYLASVPKTGQTTSYATGDDSDLEKGVAWPNPRFTAGGDNNNDGDCNDVGETCDGTVTDNLTGLIWLKNANCSETVGGITGGSGNYWADALTFANNLASGSCGLTDNSAASDWRLPNVRELYSLIDLSQVNPALPYGHPFTAVQSNYYWSSSTYMGYTSRGWFVYLPSGDVRYSNKAGVSYVWPVRGGQ